MAQTFHSLKFLLNNLIILIIFAFCLNKAKAEWTELLADTELSYTFQDNINHAVFKSETKSEHIWNGLASIGSAYQLTKNTRIFANAHIDGSKHLNYQKLDQINLGASVAIRHKFGIGAFQPWMSTSVTSGHIFSRSQFREGQLTTVGVDLGKRLHERLDISFSYRFDHRDSRRAKTISNNTLIANGAELGKSHSVFDIEGHSIGIQFNTLLTQQWLLILAYNFRDGDIVTSNRPSLITRLNRIIDAVAIDDALPGWIYRSDAQTHRYSIDANYAFLKGHAAFNMGYEFSQSFADPFSYQNNIFRLSLIYNF